MASDNLVLCGFEWGTIREASNWTYSMSEASIKTATGSNVVRSGTYSCYLNVYDSLLFSIPADTEGGYQGRKTCYVQFAVNFNSALGLNGTFFIWEGQQGSRQLGILTVGSNGQVLVYTGCTGHIDATTYTSAQNQLRIASKTRLISSTWYVFELLLTIGDTDGQITLKIDGNLEGTFSGDTGNSNTPNVIAQGLYYCTDTIKFYCFNGMWLDDVVVNASSWPGCQKIVLLRPNGNGDLIEWSKTNDYDNYEHVNDIPPDTLDYVYATQLNKTDLYTLEGLPTEAYSIATLRSEAWATKNSAEVSQNATLEFALKNGVTTTSAIFPSLTQNLSLTWQLASYAWDLTNPDTGYYWTIDDVNNLQSGIISK